MLILAALIMPALQETRAAARRGTCAFNLKALGMASQHYADLNHDQLPEVMRGQPAAIYFTKLVSGGVISEAEALEIGTCPDSAEAEQRFRSGEKLRLPTTAELETASGPRLMQLIAMPRFTYAVQLGNFDESGQHHPPVLNSGRETPMMADAPLIGPLSIRAESHGGATQNVLSASGGVRPYAVCLLPGEDKRMRDIHLNDDGFPAAGHSEDDLFLAPPCYGPDGPINAGPQKSIRLHLQFLVPMAR
jgi:hypothetical protein